MTPTALHRRLVDRKTGAQAPVFFRLRRIAAQISRCGKNFCVVKNRAARHNGKHCSRENNVS
jgi:hypothetical protein